MSRNTFVDKSKLRIRKTPRVNYSCRVCKAKLERHKDNSFFCSGCTKYYKIKRGYVLEDVGGKEHIQKNEGAKL